MAGIITFTGPSGAGKTTIITRLFQNLPALRFVPSYTTREARPSDFPSEFRHVAPEEFEELEHKGEFLWSVEAHKNRYGTRKDDVDKALLLDQYSAMTLLPDAVRKLLSYAQEGVLPFFILPPSREVLAKRLEERGESQENIRLRIAECAEWEKEARASKIPYIYISNKGTVEEAADEVREHLS